MGDPNVVAESKHAQGHLQLQLKQPRLSYISEFLGLDCAVDILQTDLFPNGKEITETFAVYDAVRKHPDFNTTDEDVTMISVGDGSTPRTAGFFAYMTHWQCISVDPQLRVEGDHSKIDRLQCIPERIQEQSFEADRVVLAAVHSHADLQESVDAVDAEEILVVAMPCCTDLSLEECEPDKEYADWACFSPKRTIKIYHLTEQGENRDGE
ncbi:hypothetical protein OB919_16010 [Halobacteria archaeon AArc-curdl1]|uniref:Uncharacterized protein n=1 Tax=Natronosalvus hydrolyticus TaxID=2979988 RepID=A0AAP2ZB12_9EURY|nr:hypothetical protein [Halobacteria archaeon AArc-curdl1]